MAQKVEVAESRPRLSRGTSGLMTRAFGACTVSAMAEASNGLIRPTIKQ